VACLGFGGSFHCAPVGAGVPRKDLWRRSGQDDIWNLQAEGLAHAAADGAVRAGFPGAADSDGCGGEHPDKRHDDGQREIQERVTAHEVLGLAGEDPVGEVGRAFEESAEEQGGEEGGAGEDEKALPGVRAERV
jgi:hypothetical protein